MKVKLHSQIGKYARPLTIRFNGTIKTLSSYNNTVEFELEKGGKYDLSVEQVEDEKLGLISSMILTIINCFKIMMCLYNLESFNFLAYNNTRPYSLNNNYCIMINTDTDIFLSYKDSSFSSAKSEFSAPYVEIKGCKILNEIINLNCSTESLKQKKKQLNNTVLLIGFVTFLLIAIVCYSAVLSKSIVAVCLCSIILLFIVVVCVLALQKIKISYNTIVSKLNK
jgi:hypothetical protein